jgi:penicillin amidase
VSATVRTLRDSLDIPHIFGSNDHDVLYALGRAHARDRFFQMDVLRHEFSGTLAELAGEAALASDVQLRTLGLRRAAELSVSAISQTTQGWLDAYASGVNSYILDAANPLPPEYAALELTRASIHPWTAIDSLTIGKGLAFGLSFDLSDIDSTTALTAFKTVGSAASFDGSLLFSEDVYRASPFDPTHSLPASAGGGMGGPVQPDKRLGSAISPRAAALAARYRAKAAQVPLLRDALERRQSGRGSNWWVASGKVTASGRPILANDPHLSLGNPSTFYEAQLRVIPTSSSGGPTMNAFGITFPGVPGIILGCNPRICWGATTNPMDVTDVYQEKLVIDGASGAPVATTFEGKPEPIVLIPQTYLVNQAGNGLVDDLVDAKVGPLDGGLTLVVPRRNHGPIVAVDLSDPANPIGLSVQYTGWGPTAELDAFRIWDRAATLDEFKQGLQSFQFGSQNFSYADVDGNIAYFTSGQLPLREDLQTLGHADGGIPPYFIRDGTHTLKHEWLPAVPPPQVEGFSYQILPFAEMPQVVNPQRGFIVNANNDPVGTSNDNDPVDQLRHDGGVFYLGTGYDRGYRIGQIEKQLEARLKSAGHFTVQDFERIQANNQLLDAEVFTPYLAAAFDHATATGAPAALAALAADPRVAEAVGRLKAWDFSTPTGIPEGWDPGDNPLALPTPSATEAANSVAATIYSVWRGQAVMRIIDGPLKGLGLGSYLPPGDVALADLRHLLEVFSTAQGHGASGVDFFGGTGLPAPDSARDFALLQSLKSALDLLAGDGFAAAFNHSTSQGDYRWGRLHRIVFEHPLGGPFNLPPDGGFGDLAPDLPGIARAGGFGTVDAAAHDVRAASVNAFMFDSGPARRFIGVLQPAGPKAEEVIPGGDDSRVPDQLPLWLTNHYHPWIYRPADVAGAARGGEVLTP